MTTRAGLQVRGRRDRAGAVAGLGGPAAAGAGVNVAVGAIFVAGSRKHAEDYDWESRSRSGVRTKAGGSRSCSRHRRRCRNRSRQVKRGTTVSGSNDNENFAVVRDVCLFQRDRGRGGGGGWRLQLRTAKKKPRLQNNRKGTATAKMQHIARQRTTRLKQLLYSNGCCGDSCLQPKSQVRLLRAALSADQRKRDDTMPLHERDFRDALH